MDEIIPGFGHRNRNCLCNCSLARSDDGKNGEKKLFPLRPHARFEGLWLIVIVRNQRVLEVV